MSWRAPWLRATAVAVAGAMGSGGGVGHVREYLSPVLVKPPVSPAQRFWCCWLGGSYLLGRYCRRVVGRVGSALPSWRYWCWPCLLRAWLAGVADSGTRLRSFALPFIRSVRRDQG